MLNKLKKADWNEASERATALLEEFPLITAFVLFAAYGMLGYMAAPPVGTHSGLLAATAADTAFGHYLGLTVGSLIAAGNVLWLMKKSGKMA